MGDLTPSLRSKVFLLLWHQRVGRCPFCGNNSAMLLEREARLSTGQILKDRICEPCRAGGNLPDVGEVQPLRRAPALGEPDPVEDAAVYLERLKGLDRQRVERENRAAGYEDTMQRFRQAHDRLGVQLEALDRHIEAQQNRLWPRLKRAVRAFFFMPPRPRC